MDNETKEFLISNLNKYGLDDNSLAIIREYSKSLTQDLIKEILSKQASKLKSLSRIEKQLHNESLFACDLKVTCSELTNRCKLVRSNYNDFFDETSRTLEVINYFQNLIKE